MAGKNKVSEETQADKETERAEEAPEDKKTRAAKKTPAGGATQAAEETPAGEATQAADETPAGEATQVSEETQADKETEPAEETPEDKKTRAAEKTPAGEATPAADETPAAEATQAADETPADEETPAADETPADETPAVEQTGSSEAPKTLTDLAELKETIEEAQPPEPEEAEPKLDAQGRAYATGKRKDAIARVWIKPGAGRITVEGRDWEVYFARPVLRMIINQPFAAVERVDQYDVWCSVKGGGLSGQAGAVRHGISKALGNYEPALRKVLRTGGFLTRDSRVVERKKYGRHKARRSHQFSKR